MRWGMGWGCFYSDPESDIIVIRDTDLGSGVARTFFPIAGRSQYYQLVIDGKNSGVPIYVKAGQVTTFKGNYALRQGPHFISIVGVGPWSTPNFFDVSTVQTAFASNRANRIHLEIAAVPTQFSLVNTGGNGGLTNWNVSGIVRFQNCRAHPNRPTWGEMDLTVTGSVAAAYGEDGFGEGEYAGGPVTYVLEASLNGEIVFSGECSGDGTIQLYDPDGNNVGSVDFVYSGDFSSGGLFVTNWPAAYYIYYKLNNDWVGTDFPANAVLNVTAASWAADVATLTVGAHNWSVGTSIAVADIKPNGYNGTAVITAVTGTTISFALDKNPGVYVSGGTVTRKPTAIKYDDGRSSTFGFDSYPEPLLPAGTYHIEVHQVSDTGEESSGTVNATQVISRVPKAPTSLAYVSDGPLTISFHASADVASGYNGYDSNSDGVMNTLDAPAVRHAAGTGTLTMVFPALTDPTFTGDRYILIRSFLGTSVESVSLALFVGSAVWAAGIATLTLHYSLGQDPIEAGDFINVVGVTNAGYNVGMVQVLSSVGNDITYALAADPGGTSQGGHVEKLDGVESGNCVVFIVSYVNGAAVLARANAPQPGRFTTAGRQLTVKWSLDTLNSKDTPTTVKLFLATSADGFNYAAPDGSVAITGSGRIRFGQVSATAGADGQYWFAIRTNGANGQSQNTDVYGPVSLNTVVPSDPVFSVRGGI